ncbi:amidohydrolase family protein [Novosphingobium soli]|uniref:Amidohydrolase family protein n=1 Tax=Novosphingobium soli TaxID=574956 RepID=A0ABV6D128_9SPHN
MLIRGAEVWRHGRADVRLAGGTIAAVGTLTPLPGEPVIDAQGGLLLPGLHDHHIHLAALAARRASLDCAKIRDEGELARLLRAPGTGWLRATGFDEGATGGFLPDAEMLDRIVPDRPLRVQHRTGRMWLLNSRALSELLVAGPPPPGMERAGDRFTGRLFDEDAWLRKALGSTPPDLGAVSVELARHGVTGMTDMSPRNDPAFARHIAEQRAGRRLLQPTVLAGALTLALAREDGWRIGPLKLHLHEAALPDFDEACGTVRAGHEQGRAVAIHCVTEVELVFALAVLETASAVPGDRIEHVSVAPSELVARMRALGLQACVQPHFIAEHGDRYLRDVEPRHHRDLYRLATLRDAGLVLAGGSDAPYGSANPWQAMAAAHARTTAAGLPIGPDEALSPEEAVALYLGDGLDLSRERRVAVGAAADLCLLDRSWAEASVDLAAVTVSATVVAGHVVHQRIDEAPGVRLARAHSPA